jgi:uncharacterized membrane protein
MTATIVAYIATLIVFVVVDILWLGYIAREYYFSQIGHLLAPQFNLLAVFVFYLVYVVGIVIFAVLPALAAGGVMKALMMGALFGFFCYATYDLTNLATLKNWSLPMSLIDMAWGSFLTGVAAAVGTAAAQRFG